jgi:divalent metal cation (Fe/Co/Zn/Cd) transporter
MEYLKKFPILLSLTGGMGIGFYFLYHRRSLTDIYLSLGIVIIVFYILGIMIRDNFAKIIQGSFKNKKEAYKIEEKEGNEKALENKEIKDKKDKLMDK